MGFNEGLTMNSMNREIEFRGRTLDGSWMYGAYVPALDDDSCDFIINDNHPNGRIVKTDTVGQYTGLKDKDGDKIYEGDIMNVRFGALTMLPMVVCFHEGSFCLKENPYADEAHLLFDYKDDATLIGNIHDNHELLNEWEDESD